MEDLWQRILRGESGIHPLTLFDTEKFKVKFGGEIVDWAPGEEYASAKEVRRIDRFTQFALVAGIDAVRQSGLDFSKEDPFRCGVIIGSGIGGLHEIEEQLARLLHKGPDRVSAFLVPKMMVNAASGHLVDYISACAARTPPSPRPVPAPPMPWATPSAPFSTAMPTS